MSVRPGLWSLLWLCVFMAVAACSQSDDQAAVATAPPQWTDEELTVIRSLSLRNLPPLPVSASNRHADHDSAAKLGQQLFFDTRLSANGKVSCASCHQPQQDFTDGLPRGVGIAAVDRHTMSLIGVAYSPWLFWDGRADSLWRQALGPLEDGREHGGTRTRYAHVIAKHYRDAYADVFGTTAELDALKDLPPSAGPLGNLDELTAWEQMDADDRDAVNQVFANIGKAMEAYQRRLLPRPSRFDDYVEALAANEPDRANALLSPDEQHGLRLFIGAADCTHCHNGPLLSNNDFHNTAIATADEFTLGEGRLRGVHLVKQGEFSCLGTYSDAEPDDCMELRYVKDKGAELVSAFRTPTLRNVARTAPYMHHGNFSSLEQVVAHYVTAPDSVFGKSELLPLEVDADQQKQLVAFLHTLNEKPAEVADAWRASPTAAE
ncbi:MAG: cytochrome-c peroxidase [Gammaproteobacteria bacterium]|nr:cytochrome-c peroxidase [Gammaproteobacteria bacterium]